MRSKIKPLKDLWFRFSGNTGLHWNEIALVLLANELIEIIPNRSENTFSHYRDTETFDDALAESLLSDASTKATNE